MSDGFKNTRLKPSATAVSTICVPGSVIATKDSPGTELFLATSLYQYLWNALGSVVVPDLDAIINKQRLISICLAKLLIESGSVESRTSNSGKCSCLPNVCRKTSGQSEEPPMPQTIAC